MTKHVYSMKYLSIGWAKIPKNKTDLKTKIISRLLALRKQNNDGNYELYQTHFLNILESIWGKGADSMVIHHNDRACVFGIIMTLEKYCSIYQRLALGVGYPPLRFG